jgi:PAS domain S-box-containing protein
LIGILFFFLIAYLLKYQKKAQNYIRSLIENNLDPLVTISSGGIITDLNEATVEATGIPREKLIGTSFPDYFTDAISAEAGYKKVLTNGFVKDYPLLLRHASGKIIPVFYNASTYKNEEGKIQGVFAAARDITEIKRLEDELIKHRDHLQDQVAERTAKLELEITERKRIEGSLRTSERELSIRNLITQVFLTVREEEMYTQVLNIILEAMGSKYGVFGYLDELGDLVVPTMTRTIWDKCQVPDKSIVFPRETWSESSWPTAIRNKKTICINKPSVNIPKGHIAITRHISLPLIHKGEVIGLIQVANKKSDYTNEDVTLLEIIGQSIAPVLDARLKQERQEALRKIAEMKLQKSVEDLKKSNEELEQFAYVASHDLQEPLRMVSSYTQLLEKRYSDKLDQDAHDFINFAVDGAHRMQRLINDLLEYSRLTTRGKEFSETDACSVLGKAIRNLQIKIEDNGAVITNGELPKVKADEEQLIRIFQNLVDNAIKFRATENPRIHVDCRSKDNFWMFSVKDNGIGIDAKYKERIFQLFQRISNRTEYSGTGIGLAICKRIIERHGGRIWMESEPGNGTTFFFTLKQ